MQVWWARAVQAPHPMDRLCILLFSKTYKFLRFNSPVDNHTCKVLVMYKLYNIVTRLILFIIMYDINGLTEYTGYFLDLINFLDQEYSILESGNWIKIWVLTCKTPRVVDQESWSTSHWNINEYTRFMTYMKTLIKSVEIYEYTRSTFFIKFQFILNHSHNFFVPTKLNENLVKFSITFVSSPIIN